MGISDDRGAPPSKNSEAFFFIDLEENKEYNISIERERIRLRNDLVEKGFFKTKQWQHMYEWFSQPKITKEMFLQFLEAIRFYNRIVHAKKTRTETLE